MCFSSHITILVVQNHLIQVIQDKVTGTKIVDLLQNTDKTMTIQQKTGAWCLCLFL